MLAAGPDELLAPGPGPSVNTGPWSPLPVVPAHLVPVTTSALTINRQFCTITEKAPTKAFF